MGEQGKVLAMKRLRFVWWCSFCRLGRSQYGSSDYSIERWGGGLLQSEEPGYRKDFFDPINYVR